MPKRLMGLGWYSEEQWPEYLRLMEDDVDKAHAVWLQKALVLERTIKKEGVEVVRVPVDLSDFDLWCKLHHRKRDGASRAAYVQDNAQKKKIGEPFSGGDAETAPPRK